MPLSRAARTAPGGAPRAALKPRTRCSSTSSLKPVRGSSNVDQGACRKEEPRLTYAPDSFALQATSAKSPSAYSACSRSTGVMKQPAALPEICPPDRSGKLSETREPLPAATLEPPKKSEDDGTAGRLNKHAAVLPPWSCTLNPKVRYQPTTLVWKVHELPHGMAKACAALDQRRYQPTSADHGLAFRLRDAVLGGATSTLTRIGRAAKVPPREGVATPRIEPFKHPTWWGCGPKKEIEKQTSTYEDLGINWQEQDFPKEKLSQSISAPLLDGYYNHCNPFMSHFSKRGPSGEIVCDVSVAGKCGPSARDPKLGRGR